MSGLKLLKPSKNIIRGCLGIVFICIPVTSLFLPFLVIGFGVAFNPNAKNLELIQYFQGVFMFSLPSVMGAIGLISGWVYFLGYSKFSIQKSRPLAIGLLIGAVSAAFVGGAIIVFAPVLIPLAIYGLFLFTKTYPFHASNDTSSLKHSDKRGL